MNNEGILTIKNGKLIKCDRKVTGNIVIPDSVTSIGEESFQYCYSLTSVTIPDSVTSIGYKSFCGCRSLTSVTIGNSVTSIGTGAFRGCSGLTAITIPDSVTYIGAYVFYNCRNLSNIIITNSVTYIGEGVFYGCEKLLNKLTEQGVFYKAFRPNMMCRGYQYNFGINRFDGEPIICEQGFHYCDNPLSVFVYYPGTDGEDIIICKVKPMGTNIKGENHKHVCNAMEVLERVTFEDIFELLKK